MICIERETGGIMSSDAESVGQPESSGGGVVVESDVHAAKTVHASVAASPIHFDTMRGV
jgi:hypothetical protein